MVSRRKLAWLDPLSESHKHKSTVKHGSRVVHTQTLHPQPDMESDHSHELSLLDDVTSAFKLTSEQKLRTFSLSSLAWTTRSAIQLSSDDCT